MLFSFIQSEHKHFCNINLKKELEDIKLLVIVVLIILFLFLLLVFLLRRAYFYFSSCFKTVNLATGRAKSNNGNVAISFSKYFL